MMTVFTAADEMHRLAKRAMDSGLAQSREDAEALLKGYRLAVSIHDDDVLDRHHQSALLTSIVLGRRVFLGGVHVSGNLDVPMRSPLPFGSTLKAAVEALGGICAPPEGQTPLVAIGGPKLPRLDAFQIRAVFAGWRGGIVPAHAESIEPGVNGTMALAPMLAAALAINEAFLHVSGDLPTAGCRIAGLDLWALQQGDAWLSPASDEPELRFLPSKLWLIGLGHLGQAYLWGLGLLPYAEPSKLGLVLQDIDKITPSTESTSVLSDSSLIGVKKTRAMAAWAEWRGFETVITERAFGLSIKRLPDEPGVALCGLDNAEGRRALDQAGFDFVVEAGLGRGHQDFRSMLVHTLPGRLSSLELWKDAPAGDAAIDAAAYQQMLANGTDQCGVTLLAGKAVGAPFVGAVASTLVLSEVLRLLAGSKLHRLIDMNLINVSQFNAVQQDRDFSSLNPGFATI
jgi:hypothetical protein